MQLGLAAVAVARCVGGTIKPHHVIWISLAWLGSIATSLRTGRTYGRRREQKVGSGYVTFAVGRSEEHTSELQSHLNLVCRLLLEKKKNKQQDNSKASSRVNNHRTTAIHVSRRIP